MAKRTLEELQAKGFEVVFEEENTFYLAKRTSDEDTIAYHMVSKKTGYTLLEYANTINLETLRVLNVIASKFETK